VEYCFEDAMVGIVPESLPASEDVSKALLVFKITVLAHSL
jgi:hypothetical protein